MKISVTRFCNSGLPAGLIPPIEDDECDIPWNEKPNNYMDKPLKKNKVISAKVKPAAANPKRRHKGKVIDKNCDTVKARNGRMLVKPQTLIKTGKKFQCETCGKDFKRSDLLTDHVKVHKRKKPYPCDECGMMFAKPAYLKIHLRRHAGEKAVTCDQCKKSFFDKYDLIVHLRDHTGERPYVCPECGRGFKRVYILNKHKKTHSEEKPFQCNVCGKAYKYGYSYRLHMREHSS